MTALANLYEAKCSYFDPLSFISSPQHVNNIAFYINILICGTPFHEKVVFHLEATLN